MAKKGVPETTGKITFRPDPGDITILRSIISKVGGVENISDAVRHSIRIAGEHYDFKPLTAGQKEGGAKDKSKGEQK